MKKLLIPLILLALVTAAVYYQDRIINMFMGTPSSQSQVTPGKTAGPPGMPQIDLSSIGEPATEALTESGLEQTDELETAPDKDFDFPVAQDASEPATEEEESSSAPPSFPELNFDSIGETPSTAPTQSTTSDIAAAPGKAMDFPEEIAVQIPVPDNLADLSFKNSFLSFKYPVNLIVQNTSLSALDFSDVEKKLFNLSFFNNPEQLAVADFVAQSTSVQNYFEGLTPEKLDIENVSEVFVVNDVSTKLKVYLIQQDNLFVVIEMEIDKQYEFVEQILIPTIQSQII